jgi:hypothetical protein
MSDISLRGPARVWANAWRALSDQGVWFASAAIVAALAIFAPQQAADSLSSTAASIAHTAPYLVLSILLAAYAGASDADRLIARAFQGSPYLVIVLGAIAGGLSPFCSCGVIPLIAALLAMGVPLSAVMAFWLASPLMDPSMFVLTAAIAGFPFAVAKTTAAVALGLGGGLVTHAIARRGWLDDPLRPGVGDGGCGGARVRTQKPVVWRFWQEPERVEKFRKGFVRTTLFLARWLTLAFLIESLMVAWIPAEWIVSSLGGTGIEPIALATLVGIPAYLNGYAALPLAAGMMDQGMAPGAGLAFLVAGGVTSIPAAMAVFALVKRGVFVLYIALALSGAFVAGLTWQVLAG